MNPDIDSSSILSQAATQKLEVSAREHGNCLALLQIHSQFQLPFQKLSARFQHMLRRPFAFGHHYDVIRIANHLHAASGHLLVKLIQVDISQQRRQGTSLGRAFSCFGCDAILHDPGFQVLLNQPRHPFVVDLFSQQFHQQFVV